MATSKHAYLFVRHTGPNVIAQSLQLIAGRTAKKTIDAKKRQWALREARYGQQKRIIPRLVGYAIESRSVTVENSLLGCRTDFLVLL